MGSGGLKQLKYVTAVKNADGTYSCDVSVLYLAEGNYYIAVKSLVKAGNGTGYTLTLGGETYVNGNNNTDDNWKDLADTKAVAIGTTNNTIVSGDWVGYYDKTDYIKFTVDETGKYNLTFGTLDNNVKLTVYKEVTNAKGVTSLSTVKSAVTVTNKDLTVENLLLDSNTTYYVKVDAANASKDTAYTLTADFSRTRLTEDGKWTDADGVFDVQLDAKEAQSFEFSFDYDTEFDFDLDFADGVSCTLSKYVNGKETSLGSLNRLTDDFTFEADVTYALSFTNTSKTASAEFDIVKEENKLCLTSAYLA